MHLSSFVAPLYWIFPFLVFKLLRDFWHHDCFSRCTLLFGPSFFLFLGIIFDLHSLYLILEGVFGQSLALLLRFLYLQLTLGGNTLYNLALSKSVSLLLLSSCLHVSKERFFELAGFNLLFEFHHIPELLLGGPIFVIRNLVKSFWIINESLVVCSCLIL